MQCARCSGVLKADTRGGRSPRPKRRYYATQPVPAPPPTGIFSADLQQEYSEPTADYSPSPPGIAGFVHLYGRALILCGLGAFLFSATLFWLTFGVLHAGAVALPFLGALIAGLLISLGLPFKMVAEYRRFHAASR